MIELRGIAWDHPRGIAGLRATAEVFSELRGDIRIVWHGRSLHGFAFASVGELAREYDLVVLDHPHVGPSEAGGTGSSLLPLDEWLPRQALADQAAASVGASYRSYCWRDHQWALAIDASAEVAAFRPDLLAIVGAAPPRRWVEVLELATALPPDRAIGLPLDPIDFACHLLSIGVDLGGPAFWTLERGFDSMVIADALELLERVALRVPAWCLDMNPPALLERMASEDSIVYVPLLFGYANAARRTVDRHVVRFTDVPSSTSLPRGSVLGGAGLAVSSHTAHPAAATEYGAYVARVDVQRTIYVKAGGQPGHRTAWLDPHVNELCGGFYRDTLTTVEHAFLRPRLAENPASLELQARVGTALHDALAHRVPLRSLARTLVAWSSGVDAQR
jgi:multiple sugar transport system substrate-binding protein